ncbi:MAG: DNA repair protein RecO C-terminal domain-containing protein, partial [Pseudomonadota bacterium]|nr:DNA repair protein RecO C-terminal domain-containing protein [Pseudomonadota bacterium]
NNLLLCGMYMNELIYKFIPQREPCINLYKLYKDQLSKMTDSKIEIDERLLKFELLFLKEIGYEITVANDGEEINNNKHYYYLHNSGFEEVRNKLDLDLSITGEDLKLLINKRVDGINKIKNIRLIIRSIFQRLLGTKKIISYDLFE